MRTVEEQDIVRLTRKLWLIESGWWRDSLIDLSIPCAIRLIAHHCASIRSKTQTILMRKIRINETHFLPNAMNP
jgi:hypothetical protein